MTADLISLSNPMERTSSIAFSGMRAAASSMGTAAHNIANLGTQAFQREEVRQQAAEGGGVNKTVVRASVPGNELERDVVAQLIAKNSFLANLAVFRSSGEMSGALMRIQA
jgi:flagellar basal body rod protein FlgG